MNTNRWMLGMTLLFTPSSSYLSVNHQTMRWRAIYADKFSTRWVCKAPGTGQGSAGCMEKTVRSWVSQGSLTVLICKQFLSEMLSGNNVSPCSLLTGTLHFVVMHPWGIKYRLKISIHTRLVLQGEQREDMKASGCSAFPLPLCNEKMWTNKAGVYGLTQGQFEIKRKIILLKPGP